MIFIQIVCCCKKIKMTRDSSPTTEGVAKHPEASNHGAELFLNLSPLKTCINMHIHMQNYRCICISILYFMSECIDSVCV